MLPFLLAMHPVRIVVTELANARKTPAEQVRQMLFALDETVAVDVICDLQQAIQTVVQQRTGDECVLCVGSLYLVSEVKASLGKRETE
jgi:folylpolyglutamate synthase/dihydropteroate synthase